MGSNDLFEYTKDLGFVDSVSRFIEYLNKSYVFPVRTFHAGIDYIKTDVLTTDYYRFDTNIIVLKCDSCWDRLNNLKLDPKLFLRENSSV